MNPSERKEAILDAVLAISLHGCIPYNEPTWRCWDKLPEKLREKCKELKSEDIENIRLERRVYF